MPRSAHIIRHGESVAYDRPRDARQNKHPSGKGRRRRSRTPQAGLFTPKRDPHQPFRPPGAIPAVTEVFVAPPCHTGPQYCISTGRDVHCAPPTAHVVPESRGHPISRNRVTLQYCSARRLIRQFGCAGMVELRLRGWGRAGHGTVRVVISAQHQPPRDQDQRGTRRAQAFVFCSPSMCRFISSSLARPI